MYRVMKKQNIHLLRTIMLMALILWLNHSRSQSNIDFFISKFLDKYEMYSGLTENSIEISQEYVEEFKKLFLDDNVKIYDDVSKYNPEFKKINVNQYINAIELYFGEGITSISITDPKPSKPRKLREGHLEIDVQLEKSTYGFYNGQELLDRTFPLVFTLEYYKKDNDWVFKIKEISHRDDPSLDKKIELGFYLTPSLNQTIHTNPMQGNNFEYQDFSSSSNFFVNPRLTFTYYFTPMIGAGIGAGVSYFSSTAEVRHFSQMNKDSIKDNDGDRYRLMVDGQNITNKNNILYLDIPIFISFQFKGKSWTLDKYYLKAGVIGSYPLQSTYDYSGTMTYQGYYPSYQVVLYDIPEYGFVPSKQIEGKEDLEEMNLNLSAFLSAGLSVRLSQKISIGGGLMFMYGFSNIKNVEDPAFEMAGDNSGPLEPLMNANEKTHTMSFGVDLGLIYKL